MVSGWSRGISGDEGRLVRSGMRVVDVELVAPLGATIF